MKKQKEFKAPCQSIGPENIDAGVLEPLDYQYCDARDIEISISQPEFTSVCPMTGLPDFGNNPDKIYP